MRANSFFAYYNDDIQISFNKINCSQLINLPRETDNLFLCFYKEHMLIYALIEASISKYRWLKIISNVF